MLYPARLSAVFVSIFALLAAGGSPPFEAVDALRAAGGGEVRLGLDPATGHVRFVGFGPAGYVGASRLATEANPLERALELLMVHGDAFGIDDASTQLELTSKTQHRRGTQLDLQQLHRGVPVAGGGVHVHFDGSGRLIAVDSSFVPGIGIETTPQLRMPAARSAAVDFVHAELASRSKAVPDLGAARADLVVYRSPARTDHLAYQVDVAIATEGGRRVWVDAGDGHVIDQAASALSMTTPKLETKTIVPTMKSDKGYGRFQPYDQTYDDEVVVCTAEHDGSPSPEVVRVAPFGTGLSFATQQPGEFPQYPDETTVHCLIVETGTWIIDDHKIEAQHYTASVVDRKNNWVGEAQTYGQGYTNPVVLGQVMSVRDLDWSAFWDRGTSRGGPPTPGALTTGMHVGEDPDTTRTPEEIGFVVIEAAHGMIGGVEFEAGVTAKTISGIQNGPPFNHAFATNFATDPQVGIVSLAGMAGGDGGWAQLHPASPAITPTTLKLSVDEDQLSDAERSHATERVAYIVFAEEVVYPAQQPEDCPNGMDSECDDGLFCNGEEVCNGTTCDPSPGDPCAAMGKLCDEDTDQCVTGPALRMETLALTGVAGTFREEMFSHTYVTPVVVCNAEYANNTTPIVVRLRGVNSGGMQIRLQNPSDGPVQPEDVHCIVIEAGRWTVDGVKFEAQRYLSTVTDRKNGWVGEAQAYLHSYTTPTVIGQVMSHNDPDYSYYWQQGSVRSDPPSASSLRTGKSVGEDGDRTRADELVGFIVFEAGHGPFMGSVYEAATGGDTVAGIDNGPPFAYSFNQPFGGTPQIAVTSMAGVDGGDGGWSQKHAASPSITPTTLNLSCDEDQLTDTERSHATEQVSYVVFETAVSFPPVAECATDAECPGFDDFCDGPDTCVNGACVKGAPPCGGATCDETTDTCQASTPKLEAVLVEDVNGLNKGANVVPTVGLANSYDSPVVVCTVNYFNNTRPVVPRVRNVTSTSFQVYLQNPGDQVSPLPDDVYCLIAEEGAHEIDGVQFEAQKYTSTITDHDPNWLGAAQTLQHSYTNPVIVGQVMSVEDPDWSVYWQSGSVRSDPPSNGFLRNGKAVLEDTDRTRNDEVVGFIVFEAGTGDIGGIAYEAFLSADFVKDVTGTPPFTHMLTAPFAGDPEFAVLSGAGVDGNDGHWPYLFGETPLRQTEVDLAIDEDQIENAERTHTTEQVMGIVFETLFDFEVIRVLGNTEIVSATGVSTCSGNPCTTTTENLLEPGFNHVMADSGNSAQGGDYSVVPDGTFNYVPPPGFTGQDTVVYTLCGPSCDTPRTAVFEVVEMVWYVDDSTDPGGDGRSTDPFKSIAELKSASPGTGQGDTIYIFDNGNPYDMMGAVDPAKGIELLAGQTLHGGGTDLTFPGFTPNPLIPAGSRTVITSTTTAGVGVTVDSTAKGQSASGTDAVTLTGLSIRGAPVAPGVEVIGTAATRVHLSVENTAVQGGDAEMLSGGGAGIRPRHATIVLDADSISEGGASGGGGGGGAGIGGSGGGTSDVGGGVGPGVRVQLDGRSEGGIASAGGSGAGVGGGGGGLGARGGHGNNVVVTGSGMAIGGTIFTSKSAGPLLGGDIDGPSDKGTLGGGAGAGVGGGGGGEEEAGGDGDGVRSSCTALGGVGSFFAGSGAGVGGGGGTQGGSGDGAVNEGMATGGRSFGFGGAGAGVGGGGGGNQDSSSGRGGSGAFARNSGVAQGGNGDVGGGGAGVGGGGGGRMDSSFGIGGNGAAAVNSGTARGGSGASGGGGAGVGGGGGGEGSDGGGGQIAQATGSGTSTGGGGGTSGGGGAGVGGGGGGNGSGGGSGDGASNAATANGGVGGLNGGGGAGAGGGGGGESGAGGSGMGASNSGQAQGGQGGRNGGGGAGAGGGGGGCGEGGGTGANAKATGTAVSTGGDGGGEGGGGAGVGGGGGGGCDSDGHGGSGVGAQATGSAVSTGGNGGAVVTGGPGGGGAGVGGGGGGGGEGGSGNDASSSGTATGGNGGNDPQGSGAGGGAGVGGGGGGNAGGGAKGGTGNNASNSGMATGGNGGGELDGGGGGAGVGGGGGSFQAEGGSGNGASNQGNAVANGGNGGEGNHGGGGGAGVGGGGGGAQAAGGSGTNVNNAGDATGGDGSGALEGGGGAGIGGGGGGAANGEGGQGGGTDTGNATGGNGGTPNGDGDDNGNGGDGEES